MIDIYDLFFGLSPAVQAVFKLGFHAQESDFLELTPEQYEKFYAELGKTDERVFVLLPQDPKIYAMVVDESSASVFTETDKINLERGWGVIERYCSKADRTFGSDDEKYIICALRAR